MISGFACAVPAIMATRTLERQRDRLLTMLVVPLMTCSARLPVYTLIIGALFPPKRLGGWIPLQGALMVGLYGFAVLATLGAAWVLGHTVVKARRVPLILELPPYRMPHLRSIGRMVISRSSDFLREAGTIILLCTVVLWALLSFPRVPVTSAPAETAAHVTMTPAEMNPPRTLPRRKRRPRAPSKPERPLKEARRVPWTSDRARVETARLRLENRRCLVGSFAAREVFVSTMALVYGISDADDTDLEFPCVSECAQSGERRYAAVFAARWRIASGVLRHRLPV